jgi:methylphosphotriester-DNA--protein-cysteine methyltransferase
MIPHIQIHSLFKSIRSGKIRFAGNTRLKIYGQLNCWSGKRMKKENRVFFKTEKEALEFGFRACGHCMKRQNHLV